MNQEHFIKFYNNFYGYGNWSSSDWFLGIEEGGGGNIDHVNQKLQQFYTWNNVIEGLVDNYEFQSLLEECIQGRFLDNKKGPKAQSTWLPPLKALLYHHLYKADNPNGWPTLIESKMAQINHLGRIGTEGLNSTWIELFPLPNPGISNFERWNEWTSHFDANWRIPSDRNLYESELAGTRISFLKEKINQFRPKNIIAYIGTNPTYCDYLSLMSGNDVGNWNVDFPEPDKNIRYFDHYWDEDKTQKTRFFRCYHPSRTNDNAYWRRVGELML
jgi:hypothetical protein